jgi:hypothetical protein
MVKLLIWNKSYRAQNSLNSLIYLTVGEAMDLYLPFMFEKPAETTEPEYLYIEIEPWQEISTEEQQEEERVVILDIF